MTLRWVGIALVAGLTVIAGGGATRAQLPEKPATNPSPIKQRVIELIAAGRSWDTMLS